MKKYISLANKQTFYYLWKNNKFRKNFTTTINNIVLIKEDYKLLETFNKKTKYLRSYIFLESDNNLIFIDFNKKENDIKLKLNLEVVEFLNLIYEKQVVLIMFNTYKGVNQNNNNLYLIYKNEVNQDFINFLLTTNFKEQKAYKYKDLLDYVYNLDENFYLAYLNETKKEEMIYNFKEI